MSGTYSYYRLQLQLVSQSPLLVSHFRSLSLALSPLLPIGSPADQVHAHPGLWAGLFSLSHHNDGCDTSIDFQAQPSRQ